MPGVSLPRWTKPWKVVAIAMAAFGFVYGYVGTAGAPYCASMGQCLQRVVDAGPPWFYPAALLPGAIAAAILAAFVYVLFLAVYGIRAALSRKPAASGPVTPTPTPTPGMVTAHAGSRRGPRVAPLLLAVGAALVWAVMSVGPSRLAEDVDLLIARDATTAPISFCSQGYRLTPAGTCASTDFPMATVCEQLGTCTRAPITPAPRPALTCGAVISGAILPSFTQKLEADGLCHERSGGTAEPLMDDMVRGAQAGLLAFLAVGAAILIWTRLRTAGSPGA
jgi:hypothetical protein